MKLSDYKSNTVFLKELFEGNASDFTLGKDGKEFNTQEAITFIAFRKCINMPHPSVYTDNTLSVELDTIDIEPNLGIEETILKINQN
jgi:hypothetical protein